MKFSKTESKKIRKILGREYTSEVIEILNKKGILTRLGKPHQPTFIALVLSGKRYNSDVVDAILEVANNRLEQSKKRTQMKNEILK